MKYEANFKFLKYNSMKRKITETNKKESEFIVLHLLDDENNPCSFFVFDEKVIEKIKSRNFVGLEDILVLFELTFSQNWTVRLLDIDC